MPFLPVGFLRNFIVDCEYNFIFSVELFLQINKKYILRRSCLRLEACRLKYTRSTYCSIMKNICLLWTSILLGNYYVGADEVYFQLLDTKQTDNKSLFYNIINFPNNYTSWDDNKSSITALVSSEDIVNTKEKTSAFTEDESASVGKLPDYDTYKDIPYFNFTSPYDVLTYQTVPEETSTLPAEYDVFKGIPDDFLRDSSNVIRVTMEIPYINDNYNPVVNYTYSPTKQLFRVFGILFAIIAAIYGTYLKCIRKREVAEMNSDDTLRTVILIVPKTEKV